MLTSHVVLLRDNAYPHTAAYIWTLLEHLNWELCDHPPYSPDLAPTSTQAKELWAVKPSIEVWQTSFSSIRKEEVLLVRLLIRCTCLSRGHLLQSEHRNSF
jgi:transposase